MQSVDFLLGERWLLPGSLASAAAMLEAEGWTGLAIDNEDLAGSKLPGSPGNAPTKDKACQQRLDAICNNASVNAACVDGLQKDYGSNYTVLPLKALFDRSPTSATDMWRCFSHLALNAGRTAWSAGAELPAAFCTMDRGVRLDSACAPPKPSELPEMFRRLLGNLSEVMTAANKTVVVDITSTWKGDIGGPSHLAGYADAAATNVRFMDMAEYFAHGFETGGVNAQLADLKNKYFSAAGQLHMIAPAVGMTEMPGHENASCGGWPQCANVSNPRCGCIDYGWNQSALAAFVAEVERLGIREIDVWRQDSESTRGNPPASLSVLDAPRSLALSQSE
eukprot:SAG22_NODE_3714_length_1562_cov_1.432673_1_plen_336_part_00